jgi:hypothetical protein
MTIKVGFAPKKETINIEWNYIDVMDACTWLTAEQAKIVLGAVEERHDANVGINLEVIQDIADELFPR